jgi:allantoinase
MMAAADLVVHGGTVATDYGVFDATIVVRDGRVAALEEATSRGPDAEHKIDARGKLVIPGCIDPHVHYEEPSPLSHREGYESGTRASAAGGVTTVLEHPISNPPPKDTATFQAKRDMAAQKSVIDFGLWGALIPESIEHIGELHALGAVAFKGFMSEAGAVYPMVNDGQLLAGMEQAAPIDAIIGVHAEGEALTTYYSQKMQREGRRDPRAIAEGRPPLAEYEAMQRAIVLARATGARLHFVHMSIPEGAELVQQARREGLRVTCETCSHYLHMDWTALDRLGGFAKCKPPLRSPKSTEQLWQAVLARKIDFIAADHAPYTRQEKEGDIWKAGWGMTGAQTVIPTLISDGLIKRNWDLSDFARFTSGNTARLFGIYPRKGTIRIGSDGDLAVIDLNGSWTIRSEDLFYRQGWSALEGETLQGRIEQTIVRGTVVYDRGKIEVPSGFGRFIVPERAATPAGGA